MKSNKTNRFIAVVLTLLTVTFSFSSTTVLTASAAYSNENYLEDKAYTGSDLGATYKPESTKFKVWTPDASKAELILFKTGSDEESGAGVIGTYTMEKTDGKCFEITLAGDHKNEYYTYKITVNGKTKETCDVYAKAGGVNSKRSMVVDLSNTNPAGWENDKHVLFDNAAEAAVWEVHVRDMTIDPSSGVSPENRGKYLGFAESGTKLNKQATEISTGIDYLVEQGINCVQLQPVYDFGSVDETKDTQRNWGYDPMNYNVPEGSYASDPFDGNVRIRELKQLIQALHDRNISVIMDVVYNHTYTTDSAFERTVPGYYYRLKSNGEFSNGSGCGNELASDKKMYRKYMIDSVTYWVREYHMDGFRFDLMGLHDTKTMNDIRETLDNLYADDSGKKIIMYGEPWSGGGASTPSNVNLISNSNSTLTSLNERIGIFSDGARGAFRGDTNGSGIGWIQGGRTTDIVAKALTASIMHYKKTSQVVTYADCHDNLGLWDKIIISNGLAPIINASSGEHRYEKPGAAYWSATDEYLTNQLKLGVSLVLLSQGVTFHLAGDEFARTKNGDANSYASSDVNNAIDWNRLKAYEQEVAYYKGLRQIRGAFSPITSADKAGDNYNIISKTGNLIAIEITNPSVNAANEWGKMALLFNNSDSAAEASLKSTGWTIVANNKKAGLTSLGTVSGNKYSVPAKSAAVLVETATFNRLIKKAPEYGFLTTEHYDEAGTLIKKSTAKYAAGTTFRAIPDNELLFDNIVKSTEGNVTGTVTKDMNETVKFTYESNGKKSGYLTIKCVDSSGNNVSVDSKYRLREGDSYQIKPSEIQGYQMDTTKMPANIYGIFDGFDLTISFIYKKLDSSQTKVHYNNTNNYSNVSCYAYYTDESGQNAEPLGKWDNVPKMKNDTPLGGKWLVSDIIPVASCNVIIKWRGGQEPGQGSPGYPASGEIWIDNGNIMFNSKLVVSHINVKTGEKICPDEVKTVEQVRNNVMYTTSPKAGGEFGNYAVPTNAFGYYRAGVINVVYLYNPEKDLILKSDPVPKVKTVSFIVGDANQDNNVNVKDATAIQKYLAKFKGADLSKNGKMAAEVNMDGNLNVKDATVIQKYLAKFSPSKNPTADPMLGNYIETVDEISYD